MAIKFTTAYTVGTPPETFEKDRVVTDRVRASEEHFVRRGKALFLNEETGELTDMDGKVLGHHDPKADAKAAKARARQPEPEPEPVPTPERASPEPRPAPEAVIQSADILPVPEA